MGQTSVVCVGLKRWSSLCWSRQSFTPPARASKVEFLQPANLLSRVGERLGYPAHTHTHRQTNPPRLFKPSFILEIKGGFGVAFGPHFGVAVVLQNLQPTESLFSGAPSELHRAGDFRGIALPPPKMKLATEDDVFRPSLFRGPYHSRSHRYIMSFPEDATYSSCKRVLCENLFEDKLMEVKTQAGLSYFYQLASLQPSHFSCQGSDARVRPIPSCQHVEPYDRGPCFRLPAFCLSACVELVPSYNALNPFVRHPVSLHSICRCLNDTILR